jgi:hypothetical protein
MSKIVEVEEDNESIMGLKKKSTSRFKTEQTK